MSTSDVIDFHRREQKKYIDLYIDKDKSYKLLHDKRGYGAVNHGKRAQKLILSLSPKSLCDVGTGQGQFCVWAAKKGIKAVGVDIASVLLGKVIHYPGVAYYSGEARSLPLKSKSVDLVTSFDVLEHCLPEDIDTIIKEFFRVARKALVLKISYRQARERSLDGQVLHMTVRSKFWWKEKLSVVSSVKEVDKYLVCTIKK